jgi:mRNA interferase MazF
MALMPKENLVYSRSEIRWVRLNPTVGAETRKTRACLIIQNNVMNQYGQLTIVLPFLPGHKQAPYAVNVIATPQNGLDQDRYLDVGQIRAVDHQRILGRLGTLEDQYWMQIKEAIDIVLGFGFSN